MHRVNLSDESIVAVNNLKWQAQELDQRLDNGTIEEVQETIKDMRENLNMVEDELEKSIGDESEEHA